MPSRPLVIAHRGASGYRPEHTLAAYELAIEMGADFIEPDLVITRDGVLVARHENDITGTTDVIDRPEFRSRRKTKWIDGREVTGWFTEDFTLAEIKTLRARERLEFRDRQFNGMFEVPTFQEILELARRRNVGVYPETKFPSYLRSIGLPLEEPMVEALQAAGFQGRDAAVFLQSFERVSLKLLKTMTDLPRIQLLDDAAHTMATPEGLAEIATYADGIGPDKRLIVPAGPDGRLRPPTSLVEDAHRAGLLVHPWTFRSDPVFLAPDYEGDAVREIEQFLSLEVDGLFTDFPDLIAR
ncbi:MAG TPA: glycerophosphodiester phosphodiesterase [Thermoanaerobaculia bacterium]|jgi:glycerophosphoryl diester phosphodiesterase|nr:glycerophosphodiester phosphodiesterase [Thermoanaerobaculia bacterium]